MKTLNTLARALILPILRSRHFGAAVIAGVLAISAAGCGQSKYEKVVVEGDVTFNGNKVLNGDIRFIPMVANQGPTAGADIEDGRYRVVNKGGVAVGKYRVVLRAFIIEGVGSAVPDMGGDLLGGSAPSRERPPATSLPTYEVEGRTQFLPPQYNRDSPLIVTVTGDENPQDEDFNMKSTYE